MVYDIEKFEEIVKLCNGSRYAATMLVAKDARKLAEYFDNVITHAEALDWIISGIVPKIISNYKEIIQLRDNGYLNVASSILSNVEDEAVKQSVIESIKRSKQEDHLIYFYEEVYDVPRQARIRILVRMIWHKLKGQDSLD